MRLRQLLGVLLTVAVCGAIAPAATSVLKNVSVDVRGKTTTLTLTATGAFGHNEYRSNEKLFFVDLTGVSAGKLKDTQHPLNAPGVQSYNVVAYKGVNGEVSRLELAVAPDAVVATSEKPGALQVMVTSASSVVAPATTPALVASAKVPDLGAKTAGPSSVVKIRNVAIARSKDGIDVEVNGTAPMKGKVMKLTAPERVVLDIADSVPVQHTPVMPVHSGDIKSVRVARYQVTPPVTRVVVDLLSVQDYELNSVGNKLVLKLRPLSKAVSANAAKTQPELVASTQPMVSAQTAPQATPAAKPEQKGDTDPSVAAKPVVFVEPKYQTRQDSTDPSAETQAAQSGPVLKTAAVQSVTPASSQKAAAAQQVSTQPRDSETAPKPVYSGEPISVNLKDVDLKDFFRLIHEISGLNVVLDPGVTGTLTLVLDDVPWDQALDIVLKNNGLDRQLDGNVLRVATIDGLRKEAQSKRLQLEAEALAVPKVSVSRFLSYARAKDVMPTVKKLLSSRGDVVADDRMNALIIQDIPSVIPDIDRLIAQLDRKTREVDIEARVVAATRSFKRDIGTALGAGWGNGPTAVGGGPSVGESPIGGIASAPKYIMGTTNKKSIPLLTNFLPTSPTSGFSFINETNSYRVDLILAAAERRGLLKILSRPHVVTQNNVQAIVKQGMKIPITTQSQLNGPPTVTYVEAVLRLTVTPQITIDNTIFLNVDIENTQPDFSNQLQGNPVFLTQQATTQVLVTDGGTVMIGGVIQTQNSVTTDQVPFLGDVPILGNMFKRRSVDNSTQELLFIITPKIVQT